MLFRQAFKTSFVSLFVIFAAASCGSSNNNSGGGTVGTTGTSPTPTPAASPSPTPTSGGNYVYEKTTCEAMNPNYCVGAFGFKVDDTGKYTCGPDPSNGAVITGQITADEFAELNAAAEAEASSDLNAPPDCDQTGPVPGVSDDLKIRISDGSVNEVYRAQGVPKSTCYWGGRANATRLHNDVNGLMQKYYPRPFP